MSKRQPMTGHDADPLKDDPYGRLDRAYKSLLDLSRQRASSVCSLFVAPEIGLKLPSQPIDKRIAYCYTVLRQVRDT